MKNPQTQIRVYKETKDKISQIQRELRKVVGNDIRTPEVLKRTFNIPAVLPVLVEDEKIKGAKRGK